jgi:hypothetical protein
MTNSIGNVYLSWRSGAGKRRHLVGIIKHSSTQGITFRYLEDGVRDAEIEGFTPYTEFPNVGELYSDNILEIFQQRLIKSVRKDIESFYDFWNIQDDEKQNPLMLLSKTMGLVPTDNFELLASYNPVKGLSFITDLAGLSHSNISIGLIEVGQSLKFRFESANSQDPGAISLETLSDVKIGYIKRIHNRLFHKLNSKAIVDISIKAIDKNGTIKKVFVQISIN